MTRVLKAIGLAVSAAAVIGVLMAPAAQAETGFVTAPQFPAIVTGQQQGGPSFDLGQQPFGTVSCARSDLDATLFGPTDPVTFTPTYEGCTSEPGLTPVTITKNGCDYTVGFSRPGTTGEPFPTGKAHAWINCPAGQRIEIHVYKDPLDHAANVSTCTYDVGPQGPVPAGIHHNRPGAVPPDVDLTLNAKFTARSTIGAGFLPCGGDPITQHLPITVTGNYTLRAFQDFGGFEGAPQPLHVG
jgi:hypothetical protein